MDKYQEALERAKELHEAGNALTKSQMEVVFPELKESEDERIRKELIGHCKDLVRMNKDDKVLLSIYEPWLTYLERQKEQKPAKDTALQEAFINSKIDYTLEEKCDASDYAEAILPTSIIYGENEEEYKLHKIIEAAFIAGQKKEQQPAEWSEEDERNYEYLHQIICNYINNPQIEYKEREKASKVLIPFWERLKFLRPKPKQEWSEEEIVNWAYDNFRASSFDMTKIVTNFSSMDELERSLREKLKSLRPQPHWKPSEEQMEWLESAVKLSTDKPHIHGIIISLYEQLKRLYPMTKYIDAEKLIAELTKMQFDLNAAYRKPQSDNIVRAISLEYDDILSLVDSLQQEQSKVDTKMRTCDKLEMEKLYGEE